MEAESRKRKRRADIQKIILASVAIAGALSVAAVAPNVLKAMEQMDLIPVRREKEIIARSRERLLKRGMLKYQGGRLRLTPKGEKMLDMYTLRDNTFRSSEHWDGKWRILIFDIPETRRRTRDRIREVLTQVGFARLQNSVWIYPYDSEDIITLLKADLKIGRDVLYLIVDSLEYDLPYRKIFNLE